MMKYDRSYGIVPLRLIDGQWEMLLVKHHTGWWGFPKGHADAGETQRQAAERELLEETGLQVVSYFELDQLEESYFFHFKGALIHKSVHYFLAAVVGAIQVQEEEILAAQWFALNQALTHLTYKESKQICQKTIDFLQKL